jgi:hypothetical protein
MPRKKPTNPFYVALLPIGVGFALTACAFVVMMVQGGNARQAENGPLIRLMADHGIVIMTVELAILAGLTFAAIATDDFWMRRFEAAKDRQPEKVS